MSIRMTNIQNTDNTKFWQGCGAMGTHSLKVGIQNGENTISHFGRQFDNFLLNQIYSYHMDKQLCSLVFTQMS